MSWQNVAKALEMPMSTVIDACRGCSENTAISELIFGIIDWRFNRQP
jgi:hypothetical protein